MELRVIGGCGAWPAAGEACSGYLLEHDGFRLLIDPGYAVLPRLLRFLSADEVDAVFVSHRHPDHCADLNPLLRARALRDDPAPALPLFALPGALDAVLALDRPGMLNDAYDLREFEAGDAFRIGPLAIQSAALPHSAPNAGVRSPPADRCSRTPGTPHPTPRWSTWHATRTCCWPRRATSTRSPRTAGPRCPAPGMQAAKRPRPGSAALVLTHLLPGTDRRGAREAARAGFGGPIRVARAGLTVAVG